MPLYTDSSRLFITVVPPSPPLGAARTSVTSNSSPLCAIELNGDVVAAGDRVGWRGQRCAGGQGDLQVRRSSSEDGTRETVVAKQRLSVASPWPTHAPCDGFTC